MGVSAKMWWSRRDAVSPHSLHDEETGSMADPSSAGSSVIFGSIVRHNDGEGDEGRQQDDLR